MLTVDGARLEPDSRGDKRPRRYPSRGDAERRRSARHLCDRAQRVRRQFRPHAPGLLAAVVGAHGRPARRRLPGAVRQHPVQAAEGRTAARATADHRVDRLSRRQRDQVRHVRDPGPEARDGGTGGHGGSGRARRERGPGPAAARRRPSSACLRRRRCRAGARFGVGAGQCHLGADRLPDGGRCRPDHQPGGAGSAGAQSSGDHRRDRPRRQCARRVPHERRAGRARRHHQPQHPGRQRVGAGGEGPWRRCRRRWAR